VFSVEAAREKREKLRSSLKLVDKAMFVDRLKVLCRDSNLDGARMARLGDA